VRIGLIRHFPVDQAFPTGWITAAELHRWRERYEKADTLVGPFDLGGISWMRCLASDLPRAQITARVVFPGTVESWQRLREVEFAEFQTGKLRLPLLLWKWLLQGSWYLGHSSQRVSRDGFHQRVQTAANELTNLSGDTLVVSHAGMMAFLSAELRQRGFEGPKLRLAKHAQVYVYERTAAPHLK
jgi:broad specificity phosphatase PhoE